MNANNEVTQKDIKIFSLTSDLQKNMLARMRKIVQDVPNKA
jgi:hypothetical protein